MIAELIPIVDQRTTSHAPIISTHGFNNPSGALTDTRGRLLRDLRISVTDRCNFRLTGGEPLLRKNLEALIEMLAALKTHDGKSLDLTLTTNASLLSRKAKSLKAAGLQRITVSLDEAVFRAMNDDQIAAAIGLIWNQREDRYSEIRTEETARMKKVEMSYIGG